MTNEPRILFVHESLASLVDDPVAMNIARSYGFDKIAVSPNLPTTGGRNANDP